MDFLHRIARLVGTHIRRAGDVLRRAGHALRAGVPRGVGQRAHVKWQRQHDQLAPLHLRQLLHREHSQQVADDDLLDAGAGHAHMGRMEVQRQLLLPAGQTVQAQGLGRSIRPGGDLSGQGRNGEKSGVPHADLKGYVLPALDSGIRQQRGDGQRSGCPPYAKEAGHDHQPHQQRSHQEDAAARGEGRHRQGRRNDEGQRDPALNALFRLHVHHSFTGTGVLFITFMTTLWAVIPFMRLSGLSTRRWLSTGRAMCCTSSGMI